MYIHMYSRIYIHRIIYRPSVISGFEGEMGQIQDWWRKWREYTFQTDVQTLDRLSPGAYKTLTVCEMIEPISHAKYPAITVEEEAISIPLQTLALAIFDCVLVRMLQVCMCVCMCGCGVCMCAFV